MEKSGNSFIKSLVSGTSVALISTVIGVLIFSLVANLCGLSTGVIKPVNQFIKVISIFFGCVFAVKESKGLIKGAAIGALYSVLIYLLFSLLAGSFGTFVSFIIDFAFCVVIGAVSGILTVNVGNKNA